MVYKWKIRIWNIISRNSRIKRFMIKFLWVGFIILLLKILVASDFQIIKVTNVADKIIKYFINKYQNKYIYPELFYYFFSFIVVSVTVRYSFQDRCNKKFYRTGFYSIKEANKNKHAEKKFENIKITQQK